MLVHSKFISASLAFLLELTPPQFQSSFAKEPKSFNSVFTEVMFDKLWKWKVLSHVQLFATPGLYSPLNSPDQNTGVGSLSLFRRSYQSRDWTHISCIAGGFFFFFFFYYLSHQGNPWMLECVADPFSRGSSCPRNRTGVFCITGRFFTNWANRQAQICYTIV